MNPIIQRELIGALRTRRAFGLQLGFIFLLTVLVLIKWPSDAVVDLSGAAAQQVVRVVAYGLMAAVMLLAPAFPATSIVTERQRRTLELLLNSPMNRWSILGGKLVGVLGFILILLVLSLPAAGACIVMGGVDLQHQLLLIYGILGLMALQLSALGLCVSSYAGSSDSALRITYGLVLLLFLVSLGPQLLTIDSYIPQLHRITNQIRCLSPIPAMMQATGQGGIGAAGIRTPVNFAQGYAVSSLVLSVFLIGWTARRLDVRLFDRPRPAGKVTDEQSTAVRVLRRVVFLWFFDPKRRTGLIGPLTNPVLVKEFRTRRFGRAHWMMRLVGVCVILSLALPMVCAQSTIWRGVDVIGTILVILQMVLLILMTPSLASGLISGERESGGWQLLQITPLSAIKILVGKLASVVWPLLLLLVATLPGYAVIVQIDTSATQVITHVVITMVFTAIFSLLVTATISSFFKRTAAATATAYTVLVCFVAGTMLVWVGRGDTFTHSITEAVMKTNPLAAALSLIEAPGFDEYHLVPANWQIMGVLCLVCLGTLLFRVWQLTKPQ